MKSFFTLMNSKWYYRLWAPLLFWVIWFCSLTFLSYSEGMVVIAVGAMAAVGSSLIYVLVGGE